MSRAPFFPIVYVRGYAISQSEVEETVADPYMGFNVGSTKLRQRWTGQVDRHIFESPLIRLIKDYGYRDAYAEGTELGSRVKAPWKTVWIFRYYEQVSTELGVGRRPEITDYARELGSFLANIRDQTCGDDPQARTDFRVYLVAHSMGGLVVRCWLQNLRQTETDPVQVEKIFTYATPHGGIDLRLIGNVPDWVQVNNSENFNEANMRRYLDIPPHLPVHNLNGRFDPKKIFCLVGTNARDYAAARGWSSRAVGPLSDGLVQIKNASVQGAPRAFIHRAHSGHYGIVNSEEGYQNLARFFFGDMQVDGTLTVHQVPLPPKVQKKKDAGKKIRASYHVEVVAKVRGARWDMHRRTVEEGSAILAPYDALRHGDKALHLFSAFLSSSALPRGSRYLTFAIDLRVLVPAYEIDNRLFDEHIEGSYLFRDTLIIGVRRDSGGGASVRYGWNGDRNINNATRRTELTAEGDGWGCTIPVKKAGRPGIDATLKLACKPF